MGGGVIWHVWGITKQMRIHFLVGCETNNKFEEFFFWGGGGYQKIKHFPFFHKAYENLAVLLNFEIFKISARSVCQPCRPLVQTDFVLIGQVSLPLVTRVHQHQVIVKI